MKASPGEVAGNFKKGLVADLLNGNGYYGPAFIMLIATVLGGLCNYIFQIYMSGKLEPTSYSELSSILAILMIISIPSSTVQNVLIRYVAKYHAVGNEDGISWLLRRVLLSMTIVATVVTVAILFLSPYFIHVLKLSSTLDVEILAVGVFLSMISPVGSGPIQGLQRFHILAFQSLGNYMLKLVIGIGLVLLGFGVAGALGGVVLGIAFALVLTFYPIRHYLSKPGTPVESKEIWVYLAPVTIGVLCFTLITQVDVVIAGAFFPKDVAGVYDTMSMLGKIIMFLPYAISAVMFPKISQAYSQKGDTTTILKRSIWLTAALAGMVSVVYIVAPNFVITTLWGASSAYVQGASLLPILGIAMFFIAIGNLFLMYGFATDGHAYTVIMLFSALVLGLITAILVSIGQLDPTTLAWALVATGLFNTAFSTLYLIIAKRERLLRLPLT